MNAIVAALTRRWHRQLAVGVFLAAVVALMIPTSARAVEPIPGFPVVGSVSVSSGPQVIAMSPDGTRLYAAGGSRSLSLIDAQSRTLLKQVTLGAGPGALLGVSAPSWFDGVVAFGFLERGFVYLIQGETLEVSRVVRMDPTFGVAVHPLKPLLYSLSQRESVIQVINAYTDEVVGNLPLPATSRSIFVNLQVSPSGRELMWKIGKTITIADTETLSISRSFDVPVESDEFNLTPNEEWSKLFVAPWSDPDSLTIMSMVDGRRLDFLPANMKTAKGINRAAGLASIAVTPDERFVASAALGGTMYVRDLQRPKRLIESSVAMGLSSLKVDSTGRTMWGVSASDNAIFQFDLVPSRPGRVVAVGEGVPGGATVTWGSRVGAWVPGSARVTAVASPGGRSCSSEGSACTIAGLDRGKRYSIRVWAENVAGRGPVARTSVRVPDVKPPRLPAPQRPESKPEQEIS